jgi:hypothetical protein
VHRHSKHEEQATVLIFIPDAGARPFTSMWWSSGTESAHNWLMLHLEFGGGVDSNFGAKMELSEQEPGTASS